ncbi:unnamed protein product, partial [Choristocarpus tenellus]
MFSKHMFVTAPTPEQKYCRQLDLGRSGTALAIKAMKELQRGQTYSGPPRATFKNKFLSARRPQRSMRCGVLAATLGLLLILCPTLTIAYTPSSGRSQAGQGAGMKGGGRAGVGSGDGRGSGGGGAGSETPAYSMCPPRDTLLYDELEVYWGASSREIKKAYYRLAVKHHPDKNPGDAKAEELFKRVSEAYQILQDHQARARYHTLGMEGLDDGKNEG